MSATPASVDPEAETMPETKAEAVADAIKLLSEPLSGPIDDLSLLRQSLLFAEVAKLSYYRDDVVREAARQVGMEEVQYFENDGAQAYVFGNQYDRIVACRGTEPNEWNDIRADVNAISVIAESMGRVHRGFKQEVDDLWPVIEQYLRDNDKTLWFTGHSLGGAMATICAGRCKISEIPSNPQGLFTFGSPRVGDKRYINFVKIHHYRWVNNNDIVTRVPPMWMGYRHSGHEMYFNAFGRLRKYRPWRRFRDRMHGLMMSLAKWKIDWLCDHSMAFYVANIKQAIEDEKAGRIKPVRKLPPTIG